MSPPGLAHTSMMAVLRPLGPLLAAVLTVASAAACVAFAPAQLGGRAAYVLVNGESMEPELARGDLVITRPAEAYGPGDVVAYHHPDIGLVIHRIAARDGSRFVLKGDNNDWLDSYRPTSSDLVGVAWVHLPSAGPILEGLRSPGGLAASSTLMGVLIMSLFADRGRVRRPAGRRRSPEEPARPRRRAPARRPGLASSPARTTASTGVLALLLGSVVLGGFAFTRPATVAVVTQAEYDHTGVFGYSAEAPAGLYDGDRAGPGDPVFRAVTDRVDLEFDYRMRAGRDTSAVEGSYRIRVRVSDQRNGWKRTLLVQPETTFAGGRFSANAVLDLTAVQRVVTGMERQTGVRSDRYSLAVLPEVSVDGRLGDLLVEERFTPQLDFWLDTAQLQLQAATAPAVGDPDEQPDPLRPVQAGGVTQDATVPATLPVLTLDLPVPAARLIAVLGAALAVAHLLWAALPLLRALRGDEAGRITARHGSLLIAVTQPPAGPDGLVPVARFADLVRMAGARDRMILHRVAGGVHDFYLPDAGVTYCYRAGTGIPAVPVPQPRQPLNA